MRPFAYTSPRSAEAAVMDAEPGSKYLAGGTTLLDLMKLDVLRPDELIDITRIDDGRYDFIEWNGRSLRIGALTSMSRLADEESVRERCPVLTDSLWLAASAQLRNLARLGGNVLQMTRCPYFRDTTYEECNKRVPGSGCAALDGGVSRNLAILGTSPECIASYPGDWGQALVALDAVVEILGKDGPRSMRFDQLHRRPGDRPDLETTLREGDLITAFTIPDADWPRSKYLKIRDRESYAFALTSTAAALRMNGSNISDIRLALGGVATVPWRARQAEQILQGQPLTPENLQRAADVAFDGANTTEDNAYKVELGKQTLIRAVTELAAMEA